MLIGIDVQFHNERAFARRGFLIREMHLRFFGEEHVVEFSIEHMLAHQISVTAAPPDREVRSFKRVAARHAAFTAARPNHAASGYSA
ncbi:hypothetical protein D3C71_1669690 [compost metagenome]